MAVCDPIMLLLIIILRWLTVWVLNHITGLGPDLFESVSLTTSVASAKCWNCRREEMQNCKFKQLKILLVKLKPASN